MDQGTDAWFDCEIAGCCLADERLTKASRLQSLASIAPLVAPHFRGLLDLKISEQNMRDLPAATLLFYGGNSFLFERQIADRFARLRPDLGLHVIDGAEHNVHWDRSGLFNALALPFLMSGQ